jgi:hypothetical protein
VERRSAPFNIIEFASFSLPTLFGDSTMDIPFDVHHLHTLLNIREANELDMHLAELAAAVCMSVGVLLQWRLSRMKIDDTSQLVPSEALPRAINHATLDAKHV